MLPPSALGRLSCLAAHTIAPPATGGVGVDADADGTSSSFLRIACPLARGPPVEQQRTLGTASC